MINTNPVEREHTMHEGKVADLSVEELRALIREEMRELMRETVREVLAEVAEGEGDPDAGLEFKAGIAERLQRFLKERPAGRPLDDIAGELGLDD
jgi:hypothetical protein